MTYKSKRLQLIPYLLEEGGVAAGELRWDGLRRGDERRGEVRRGDERRQQGGRSYDVR